jgi:dienelactone hydrolase
MNRFVMTASLLLAAGGASATATIVSPQACAPSALAPALARFGGEQASTLDAARWRAAGPAEDGKPAGAGNPLLPAHCLVTGTIGAHRGAPGDTLYGNHFRLRIPASWNGRFLFQGGGGNNGVLGGAFGLLKDGNSALAQGYAVIAQDSGHVGRAADFALDRKAYHDFAYQSVHDAAQVGKALVTAAAGQPPAYSYFVGCSNGGREALVSAQRYADFDGVVAGDPGMAIYDQWVQNMSVLHAVNKLAGVPAGAVPADTSRTFSDAQLHRVADYFMDKCDRLDGIADGLMSNYQACKAAPADLRQLQCRFDGGASADPLCLSGAQTAALATIYDGARNSAGELLFPGFSPGSIERGLREAYLGVPDSVFPLGSFYNSILPNFYYMGYGWRGYPGLTGPADEVASYPKSAVKYVAGFNIDSEPARLEQGRIDFHGANVDSARPGPNFDAFVKRGGKMLVYTGTADPAVQPSGVMAFMDRLKAQYHGASNTARLFMVPGMLHCRGGATTDGFDELAPLAAWVEHGVAPERIVARAAPGSALDREGKGVARPLCAYPKYATYKGGNPGLAESFACSAP